MHIYDDESTERIACDNGVRAVLTTATVVVLEKEYSKCTSARLRNRSYTIASSSIQFRVNFLLAVVASSAPLPPPFNYTSFLSVA